MDRHAVALVLEEVAALLDAAGSNPFKARAFRTAARAVDRLEADLATLVAAGRLQDVRGLGPATARVVEELVATGESAYHAELRERAPAGMRDLLRVPGLGPGRIARLHEELGVHDLDALETAARDGRIAALRGFGVRIQQQVLDGVAFARAATGRRRYHHAEETATRITSYVAALPGIRGAEPAGELRRCHEVVDGIVVVAIAADPADAAARIRRTPGIGWDEGASAGSGPGAKAGVPGDVPVAARGRLSDGLGVTVHIATPDVAGAALLLATGSAAHVAGLQAVAAEKGLVLAGDGLRRDGAVIHAPDEAAVYDALGLPLVAPELREDGTELELAWRDALPQLVTLAELRGCFHCHTTYSDGRAGVHEMAEAALAMGWRFLGIADHSRSAGYAGGLSPGQLRRQRREIDEWNRQRGAELRLLAGVEADILADGQLDYAAQGDGDVLDALDYVIGSVHSNFRMPRDAMTARISRAVGDRRLTMLGHATGRLLLTRDGYAVDLDAVAAAAAASGALLEINADPHRLDLSWQHWPAARERGVRTAINPDAHSVEGLRNVRYGVNIARKARFTAADVLNTWPVQDIVAFLQERKGHGTADRQ
jgi:DNA polymerase (family X)